ncbi:MAG: uracil-DNA glycosylase [Rhodobacter sp.]|nr:uracil-DNA glycosylase [Rhodobacter sp.]
MGIAADISADWRAALAALAWQVEAGADEACGDVPVNRYELAVEATKVAAPAREQAVPDAAHATPAGDPVAVARAAAAAATTLDDLREAMAAFDLCELKRGARNTVFSDGNPAARVLVLGEAPGREEDLEGRPFVGRAGQLLDQMFAAIGLSRTSPDAETALYITNVMPWRPPGNRDPDAAEIAMMRPFVERHISLTDPEVIVVMGNTPLEALTGTRGILRARGTWTEALGKPMLPMTHPAYLLRNPAAKREAWADLLSLQARLRG